MATSSPHAAVGNRAVQATATCPECGGGVVTDSVESACRDCGLVLDDAPVDRGPDWRSFDAAEGRAKAHAEPVNPDRQGKHLGSEIGFATERDRPLQRQNQLHRRAKAPTKKQQNLRYSIGEIERVASALELSARLVAQAVRLFRRLSDGDYCFGHDLDTLAATCVYTACRKAQRGIAPADIEAVARTDARRIAKRHTWVCTTLEVAVAPPDPRNRVRVVARKAGMDSKVAEAAVTRLDAMDDASLYRGSPSTLAAAALYEVGDETQAAIADAAGCTATSLRNRWQQLAE